MEGPFSQLASNFILFSGKKSRSYINLSLAIIILGLSMYALFCIYNVPRYQYSIRCVNDGAPMALEKFHLDYNFLKSASTSSWSPSKLLNVEFKAVGDSDAVIHPKLNYSVSVHSVLQDFNGSDNLDLSTKSGRRYRNDACEYRLKRKDRKETIKGADYCFQQFTYEVYSIKQTPVHIQRKLVSKLSEYKQLTNSGRLLMPEDISKGVFSIGISLENFKEFTEDTDFSLTVNFGGPCEFSDIYPEPDQKHVDRIVYTDLDKIRMLCDMNGGLRMYVKYPDLENIQSSRVFFLTTIISLLLAFICKYIIECLEDYGKKKKLKKIKDDDRFTEDAELILVKRMQNEKTETGKFRGFGPLATAKS